MQKAKQPGDSAAAMMLALREKLEAKLEAEKEKHRATKRKLELQLQESQGVPLFRHCRSLLSDDFDPPPS